MAESMLNGLGVGRFNAFSAGLRPGRRFDHRAIAVSHRAGYLVERSEPASWREFEWVGAPRLDLVITLGEPGGPTAEVDWRGEARVLSWRLSNPCDAAVAPALRAYSLRALYRMLENRISVLVNLPEPMVERVMRAQVGDLREQDASATIEHGPDAARQLDRRSRLAYGRRRTDRRVAVAA